MRDSIIRVGTIDISDAETKYIFEALRERSISCSDKTILLERMVASYHNVHNAICCGTLYAATLATLHVLNSYIQVKYIAIPAMLPISMLQAVIASGIIPVICDVDPTTLEMDLTNLPKSRIALLFDHPFGNIIQEHKLFKNCPRDRFSFVVESMSRFIGVSDQIIGDIAILGCEPMSILTIGSGGIILTSNDALVRDLRSFINCGRESNFHHAIGQHSDSVSNICGIQGEFNEFQASIGIGLMGRMEEILIKRKRNATKLISSLSSIEPISFFSSSSRFASLPILCPSSVEKDQLIYFLNARKIETAEFPGLINQPVSKVVLEDDLLENKFPEADMLLYSGFQIGCHQNLNDEDINYIIATFVEFYG